MERLADCLGYPRVITVGRLLEEGFGLDTFLLGAFALPRAHSTRIRFR